MIIYQDNLNNLKPEMLNDFFDGWKKFPSKEKHFKSLQNSEFKILAIDDVTNKVIGFINAISDGVLSAYIPLLEVIPDYKNKGIGTELVNRMLEKLKDYYMIDIVCDYSLQGFYEKSGMKKHSAMILRNYENQNGI